jgi:hypothetical protein
MLTIDTVEKEVFRLAFALGWFFKRSIGGDLDADVT